MSKETQPHNLGSELAPQEARGFASFQRGVDNFRNAHPDDPQMQNLADIGDSVVSSMQAVGNAALETGQRVKENQAFAVAAASVLLASFLAACDGEGQEVTQEPVNNTPVPAQTETPKPTNTPLPEAPAPATAVATEVATQEATETPETIAKRFNVNDLAAEGGHHVAEGVPMTDEIRQTITSETLSELGRVDAEHPLCNGNACDVYVFTGENGHQRQSYMLVTPNGETIIPINDQGEQWYGPSQGAIDMNLSEVVPPQVDKDGRSLRPVILNEFAVSTDGETLVPGPIDRLAFTDEEGNVLTMVISPFGDRYTQMWHPNAESSFPSNSPLLANGVPNNAELISVRDADSGSMYAGWLPVDEDDGSFRWDEGFTDGNGAQGYFVRGGGLANADAWTWIGDEPVPTATAEAEHINLFNLNPGEIAKVEGMVAGGETINGTVSAAATNFFVITDDSLFNGERHLQLSNEEATALAEYNVKAMFLLNNAPRDKRFVNAQDVVNYVGDQITEGVEPVPFDFTFKNFQTGTFDSCNVDPSVAQTAIVFRRGQGGTNIDGTHDISVECSNGNFIVTVNVYFDSEASERYGIGGVDYYEPNLDENLAEDIMISNVLSYLSFSTMRGDRAPNSHNADLNSATRAFMSLMNPDVDYHTWTNHYEGMFDIVTTPSGE